MVQWCANPDHHGHEWEFAEVIYRVNPQDFVNPNNPLPAPTVIHNALQQRGSAGRICVRQSLSNLVTAIRVNGWMVGVLDGPEQNQRSFTALHRTRPTAAEFRRLSMPTTPRLERHRSRHWSRRLNRATRAFGFGSVPVMFETAPGFMQGFRDYMNNFADAVLGTQAWSLSLCGQLRRQHGPGCLADSVLPPCG